MKKILFAPVIILLILIYSTCSFTGNSNVTVSPEIRAIGLPSASNIISVELTVSGPGMNTIWVVYDSLPSSIELSIPSGSDRTFELVVYVDIPIIAATSFKGTATADLTQDSVTIYLTMGVGSTRIVVPDPEWNSGLTPRISQFDDISGLNGISLDFAILWAQGIVGLATFAPYDIDFDNQGRIYIANNAGSTESGFIRVDNITGLNPIYYNRDSTGIVALTVDRTNSLIYYSDGNNIYKSDLDGNYDETLINITFGAIQGLAVANGFLYIADGGSEVGKYSLTLNTVVENTSSDLSSPWDILVKDDKLYVANLGGADGYQILELSTSDLSLTGHFGNSISVQGTDEGDFYGPRRFAVPLNNELVIVDDSSTDDLDKLIHMDNINGDNWTTLPVSGDGQILFKFYYRGP